MVRWKGTVARRERPLSLETTTFNSSNWTCTGRNVIVHDPNWCDLIGVFWKFKATIKGRGNGSMTASSRSLPMTPYVDNDDTRQDSSHDEMDSSEGLVVYFETAAMESFGELASRRKLERIEKAHSLWVCCENDHLLFWFFPPARP